MQVPRVASFPADPGPSFLKLYPEIRNRIYSYLLEASPIVVSPKADNKADSPDRTHVPGIALLHTCRQIYHEATSVLYTNNEFLCIAFARGRERRKCDADSAQHAGLWLKNLGSQVNMLRQVRVKIEWRSGALNILWILDVCWSHPWTFNISFELDEQLDPGVEEGFNNMFYGLVNDHLKVKRYRRLMSSLYAFDNASGGCIELSPLPYSVYPFLKFGYDCPSNRLYFNPERAATFLDIPWRAKKNIFKYVLYPEGDGCLDKVAFSIVSLVCRSNRLIAIYIIEN
ncbi:hypothetical protein P154DRAFT_527419 [Amniculicola lignicola CBS 123094]|uniref:Uncharacterized protein n=1 Tax=Amniculicola lignicola CBS 123094 TaxID=1392246 RepID=A0A6A5VWL9_9PLEO|nr:hypothetical protein P154DRAFT_527419 [Amniculicola lignicola CBS 123094]